jgi:hypothetical protein
MPAASVRYQDDEKQAMARAAVTLLAHWGVSDCTAGAILDGASSERTERAAVLLGIHAALRQIFPDGDRAACWVGAKNSAFGEKSALGVMQAEGLAGMQRVKAYLDAEIAG